jgi:hypothetical protein
VERLINTREAANRLGISVRKFFDISPALQADGLRQVKIKGAKGHLFLESSLDALIRNAAQTETTLGELEQ